MAGSPVRVTGRLTCTPDDPGLVHRLLPDHVRLSGGEPGCLSFDVTQSPDDLCVWFLDETFTSPAAFEAHRALTRTSAWGEGTGHLTRDVAVTE